MRPSVWATFLAIALVALGLGVVPAPDGRKPHPPTFAERVRGAKPVSLPRVEPRTFTFDIKSDQKSLPDDARADVVGKAQAAVAKLFEQQSPSVDWTPPPRAVAPYLYDWKDGTEEVRDLGTMHVTSATLRLNPDAQRGLLAAWHEEAAARRMWWLGGGLIFLVTLLGTVAGYVRLDDWSKGYLTGWLVTAGVVILLLSAGLIWFTM